MGIEKYKPSKKELLMELESIRDILDEEVLESLASSKEGSSEALLFSANYLASIPKLTNEVKIENMQEETTEGEVLVLPSEKNDNSEEALPSEESAKLVESVTTKEKETPQNTEEAKTPDQQSLFDVVEEEPQKVPAPNNSVNGVERPQKADNPFLPPHIRERLDQNKQQALVEELNLLGESLERNRQQISRASVENEKRISTPGTTETNDIVDQLVKEYLPILEKELKRRLKAKLKQATEQD